MDIDNISNKISDAKQCLKDYSWLIQVYSFTNRSSDKLVLCSVHM